MEIIYIGYICFILCISVVCPVGVKVGGRCSVLSDVTAGRGCAARTRLDLWRRISPTSYKVDSAIWHKQNPKNPTTTRKN